MVTILYKGTQIQSNKTKILTPLIDFSLQIKITKEIMENLRNIERNEIEEHRTLKSCWLVIHGKVYDVTTYLHKHPAGGVDLISL